MSSQVSQIDLIAAIFTSLDKQDVKTLTSRQINAVIAAADTIMVALDRAPVMTEEGMGSFAGSPPTTPALRRSTWRACWTAGSPEDTPTPMT